MDLLSRTLDCRNRLHCVACRGNESFRQSLLVAGMVNERDFACPFGVTAGMAASARFDQSRWPAWARLLARLSLPGEHGVGDTIAARIGPLGGEAFTQWFKKLTGADCRCDRRQQTFNRQYPYQWTPAS